MSKIAFLYPGQGSQYTGMGKDFYGQSPAAKEIFDKGSEILGIDLCGLCFEENPLLGRTDHTQAALVTVCMAITAELKERGVRPDLAAGLSLGEYCAVTAAGGMDFADTVKTAWIRGSLMHNAVPDGSGGMAAVLGLDGGTAAAALEAFPEVSVANYNCPGQIVITGKKTEIDMAAPKLKAAGAKRVLPLNVSGPFHSMFLKEAGEELRKTLEKVNWHPLQIPYVTNVDAGIVTDISRTKELLCRQVYSSVLWEQTIRTMLDAGADTFIEVGPGKTLSGFMRKIDRNAVMLRVGTMEELECLKEKLQ